MSSSSAIEYLESLKKQHPDHALIYNTLINDTRQKLWHQVSSYVLSLISSSSSSPSSSSSSSPSSSFVISIEFFEKFLRKIGCSPPSASNSSSSSASTSASSSSTPATATKIRPFDYAKIANQAQAQLTVDKLDVALSFLSSVVPEVAHDSPSHAIIKLAIARRLIQDHINKATTAPTSTATATTTLTTSELERAKSIIDETQASIKAYSGVMEASVHSLFYCASSEYYKVVGPAASYFDSAMLFLTYTDVSSLSPSQQLTLAVDIGTAALIGTSIYNFGELLQNPIMNVLQATPETQHIYLALKYFNEGNIQKVKDEWPNIVKNDASGVLLLNEVFLNEKLRIMALMEMVFARPPTARTLTFSEIASGCDLPIDEVEWLVMKSLALGVLKGEIDQVKLNENEDKSKGQSQGEVRITYVQPRVLDKAQLKSLRDKLDQWATTLHTTINQLEDDAHELIKQ